MIEVHDLVKRYGATTAVDGLSFTVKPGRVTGFLGPNGAGKSTTMRMIIGLDRPTAGLALINGKRYREHKAPLCVAGALLEARSIHRGRSARTHLLGLARTHGLPDGRVGEVLEEAGIANVARRRAGTFSLGMGQRLGIAAALLGDPAVVILDEPVNGLDPDGVLWVRTLIRELAADGRTVLVSSHLMSEMAVTADHLVIVGGGRLLADTTVDELIGRVAPASVTVRTPEAVRLRSSLLSHGATVSSSEAGELSVAGLDAPDIGALAAAAGIVLHELTPRRASLEQAYMELTR
ncbi:ABC transporter ATP-binding protein [Paractinoplanes lichenicola]|uniref:ATP-binding cassette domain-containing protein n=1 Tax=Paractinoplanes lichenicola TaxID=2802976 RepID=A0ABS1VS26_9ACTN|nr:ATP-binding cassette domain-containing protein [Actinoplanes lichenicola]MBL7257500.1 ATP-binding cassette domain-containing protein [Actinoplanes lichenicola]